MSVGSGSSSRAAPRARHRLSLRSPDRVRFRCSPTHGFDGRLRIPSRIHVLQIHGDHGAPRGRPIARRGGGRSLVRGGGRCRRSGGPSRYAVAADRATRGRPMAERQVDNLPNAAMECIKWSIDRVMRRQLSIGRGLYRSDGGLAALCAAKAPHAPQRCMEWRIGDRDGSPPCVGGSSPCVGARRPRPSPTVLPATF